MQLSREEQMAVSDKTEAELYRDSVPALVFWYAYNARVLPWREDPTPYHVWISEIMLQQTRVEAVRGYYDRFLSELPTVEAVANAPEDRLIKLWEGLGYYSRVRNIAKAARLLCEHNGGVLPDDYDSLRSLPGIGDYTAGAIASIAYGQRVPAVDGNVLRVYARLTAYREDIRAESFKKHVRKMLTDALEAGFPDRTFGKGITSEGNAAAEGKTTADGNATAEGKATPGQFNQAVMDIGATVCIPNGKPHCDVCPLAHLCRAYAEDLTEEIPAKPAKKARPVQKKTILLITDGERVLLHRRPEQGLLAGLWEFPNLEGHLTPEGARKAAAEIWNEATQSRGTDEPDSCRYQAHRLKDCRHVFSHVEWEMRGYRICVAPGAAGETRNCLPDTEGTKAGGGEYVRVTADELEAEFGLPTAFKGFKLQL